MHPINIIHAKKQFINQGNILVIDSLELIRQSTGSLADIIKLNSLTNDKQYGPTLSLLSFRGISTNGTLYFVNRIPIISSTLGTFDPSILPNLLFKKVSLYYESEGLQYSSGGVGALINMDLKSARDSQFSISSTVGSFGKHQISIDLPLIQTRSTGLRIGIYRDFAINNYPFINYYAVPTFGANGQKSYPIEKYHNAFRNTNGAIVQIDNRLNKYWTAESFLWYQTSNAGIPNTISTTNSNQSKTDSSIRIGTSINYKEKTSFWRNDVGFTKEYLRYKLPTQNINNLFAISKIFAQSTFDDELLKGALKYSLSGQFIQDKASSPNFVGDKYLNRYSCYSGFSLGRDSSNHLISLKNRIEWINNKMMPSSVLSINYNVLGIKKESLFIKFQVSKNYVLPGLNDLYWNPGGNPNLLPEYCNSVLTSFYGRLNIIKRHYLKYELLAFVKKVNNKIQWLPTTSGYYAPININKVDIKGVEGYLTYFIDFNKFCTQLTFKGSLLDAKDVSNPALETYNKQLIYVPAQQYTIDFQVFFNKLIVGISSVYNGKKYTLADNSQSMDGFALFHIDASYQIKVSKKIGCKIFGKIKNVGNASYEQVPLYPMPGRYFELGSNLSF